MQGGHRTPPSDPTKALAPGRTGCPPALITGEGRVGTWPHCCCPGGREDSGDVKSGGQPASSMGSISAGPCVPAGLPGAEDPQTPLFFINKYLAQHTVSCLPVLATRAHLRRP